MKLGKVLLIMLLAVLGSGVLVGGCFYRGYNQAVTLDQQVASAWAEVDNQLQRRFELMDNLVETVKGFAGQEKDIFLGIAESRKSYFSAQTPAAKAKAAGGMGSVLSRLLVFRESYPELKSNESFLKLQDSVEGTENRLGQARRRYNEAVTEINTFSRKLLGRIYSSMAGVEKAEYYKMPEDARTVPKVDFSPESKSG